tara:strand:- start:259 stop:405 length:147 start_codon:yes stop_codon:yes gene_type:complete
MVAADVVIGAGGYLVVIPKTASTAAFITASTPWRAVIAIADYRVAAGI